MKDKKTILAEITTAISIANNLYSWSQAAVEKYNEKRQYTLTLKSNGYAYQPMLMWLNDKVKPKTIDLYSTYQGIKRLYSAGGEATVNINGYDFSVSIKKPDIKAYVSIDEDAPDNARDSLVFTTRNPRAIAALEELLEELTEQEKASRREVMLYGPPGNYGWESKALPFRDIESVFLPEGEKESLISDIQTFLDSEKRYRRIGIPWHRGYLLHGPPGNGKSSLAAALAHHFHLNLYSLPLSTVKDDKALAEAISRMGDNAILLLEDIDIFTNSLSREQHDTGPTLAGLLNALDGVSTPHGLITIMTTNCADSLEDALVRKGRIDYRLELKSPVKYQIEQMFFYAYDETLNVEPREFKNMAEVSDIFKRFTNDPESARMEIKDGFSNTA